MGVTSSMRPILNNLIVGFLLRWCCVPNDLKLQAVADGILKMVHGECHGVPGWLSRLSI